MSSSSSSLRAVGKEVAGARVALAGLALLADGLRSTAEPAGEHDRSNYRIGLHMDPGAMLDLMSGVITKHGAPLPLPGSFIGLV